MSHFPIHHASIAANPTASAAHFLGEAGEATIGGCPAPPPARDADGREVDGRLFVPAGAGERTVAQWAAQARWQLEPLLLKYGVDVYDAGTHLDLNPHLLCSRLLSSLLLLTAVLLAGHVHDYCVTWPMNGTNATQTDFTNPRAPVHVTEGNGGVPGLNGESSLVPGCSEGAAPWCRAHGTGGAYGRFTAPNATHLHYEHVVNNGGNVSDTWTIVQTAHGPFA